MRIAILTAEATSGSAGGAERFYQGLLKGLQQIGCDAECMAVPADEPDFAAIKRNYEYCRALDLSQYDVVISTKAPTFAVSHPNHVMYLVHTVRVFDDMFDIAFPEKSDELFRQRAALHQWDIAALSKIKARFAIGHEVAKRLYRWRGIGAEVIHPPLGISGFKQGAQGDYFFLPGRLHPWKRVDLIIKAIRLSKLPLRLVIAGVGEAESELKLLAEGDGRIEFLGRIEDERLIDLYSGALAVPFVPIREDYGYVTLEAFASGKPVLTCTDSGEPAHFVQHMQNGLICQPTPEAVRAGLEWLHTHREECDRMGREGARIVAGMSWTNVARQLVESALRPAASKMPNAARVSVIDMQPIDPPIGGGRLRLLGLYHGLGKDVHCQYIGTYDWPGEKYRQHMLTDTLEEIDVPLSDAHHAAAAELSAKANGKTVIDIAFSTQGVLSPAYLNTVRESIRNANVVVFSHPWVYPLVVTDLNPSQVVIYDSHNVEGFLRAQLLDEEDPVESDLLRRVVQDENDVGWAADWILTCSHEDMLRFHRIYGFPLDKMRVVPNGVKAFTVPLPTPERKRVARQALNIDAAAYVAIFIGSPYGPNVQSARFIIQELAPIMPEVIFVIAGGVGQDMKSDRSNVRITGGLNEKEKNSWLYASDIAVNPMMSGSGTNIKMFDFMAMCLPVVTTAVGARGIDTGGRRALLIVEPSARAFAKAIDSLRNMELREQMGREARRCVEDGYAWERISAQLGCFMDARRRCAGQPRPLFSVVVPTYERHDQLNGLFRCLQQQIERDFEVVVVDQSATRWEGADRSYGFPLTYFHSPVKGAVRARNTGAMLAQGTVIAFVDDDCQPAEDWLVRARTYFADPYVVGVEGLIYSDHLGEPDWRPVTNVGFEGIGFMTANLFVRSSIFQYLGGFDLQFDHPHFREDTDLGWRMLDLGKVAYAKDVRVFHPAQPRSKERESVEARNKFFEKDALLYMKHPERYRELFFGERHYELTPGFAENLRRGFERHNVALPAWIESCLKH